MSRLNRSARTLAWAFLGATSLLGAVGVSRQASSQVPAKKNAPADDPTAQQQPPGDKAWHILRKGLREESADKRAKAVRALGLLPGNAEAEEAAMAALKDAKPNVRVTAASALGSMRAARAKQELEAALEDSEPGVVLAAANSLLVLHDDAGYDVYYAVLTGEKRASKGLIKEQLDTLKDKKKVAQLGFEEGIGFIPFAGIGYEVFKTVRKNDASPIRAAAAKRLAHDPTASSGDALAAATKDKNWAVRAAALEAIAERGDKSLVEKISATLDDEKDEVRYTAAACIAHLSEEPAKPGSANGGKQ